MKSTIDQILKDYTSGEADLEATNAALAEAGAGFSLQPGQNEITDADRQETVVGYYPHQANGYGLLDTGTGSMEKVPVKEGRLPFAVNEVQPNGGVNSYAQVIICGRVYDVRGDTLAEPVQAPETPSIPLSVDMSRRPDMAGQEAEQRTKQGLYRVSYDELGYAVKARRM